MQPRSQSSKRIQELREQWKAQGKLISEETLNEFFKRRGSVSFEPMNFGRRPHEKQSVEELLKQAGVEEKIQEEGTFRISYLPNKK